MADMNRATLYGRLGGVPEIRTLDSGDKVASFSLATGEKWKDKATGEPRERTEWHRIVVFGPMAKVAEKYLKKGSRCIVEGAIRTRKWLDQSGNDRWTTEIVLSGFGARLDVIDWPEEVGGAARGHDEAYGDLPGAHTSESTPHGRYDFDDDIPF